MENNISLFEHVIKFLSQVFDVSVEDNKIRSIKIRSEIKDCPRRYLLTGNFAQLNLFSYVYSEISNNDLILNRGVSLELEKIHLSDVSSDVRTNGGWGKLYKEVSGKELNESGFGTVKICDGLYGIKDGLFNIYEHSNKEYGINEF